MVQYQKATSVDQLFMIHHLDLNGIALITIWWYTAANAAPMKGPTQNIHYKTTYIYQDK